jgi:hypothetical protein
MDSAGTEAPAAPEWTCGRCEVTVSWMPGAETPDLPMNWVDDGVDMYCLGCRRDLAAEAGVAALDDDAPADLRQKTSSQARIEFEITRDPERPDNRIAKSCRTSVITVRKARERLGLKARPPRTTDAR